ncbi:uroporphyrinogen decarboxylase [Thermosporothrix hazakensis]|uniref:Uroporphyrinogen decarboxylase n=2 Tax=Thermosporothrix TaxID=768650 RepID=A0A326U507_THEHA|nr:uroporphyrinogen decarboxylase [Thermosporothrix hazakensis]PZW26598.1 uroporphyrinogen decarboxylase [Thermosporothrix hazakensis]BBH89519.1 uroporphyrinogen decarboxylase [Thermosporothrix sp. COM3]GCE47701.1 uroporphyrinogen decarboxylase [Thermosporothrix hazakensis]
MQEGQKTPHTGVARFMAACRREQPDMTPVWFMRQAGRCLAEYREMRRKYDILYMAKNPELATEVTLMPIKTLGVDAAVLYADIMLPLEGMGISLEIQPEVGPIIHNPVRSLKDVEALRVIKAEESVPYVLDALRLVRRELDGKQAVIGFSGAPFTLACYMIEGKPSRDYGLAKSLMYGQPEIWDALMNKLSDVVADYLVAQVRAGAQVVQLFDSWVGAVSPSVYRRAILPYTRRIFETVKAQTDVPTIHFGTGTAALLEAMTEAGGDVISVDWRVDLDDAWKRIGYDHGIQGNLDPTLLLADWSAVEAGVKDILRRAENRPGHIFNLGHGVLAQTEPDRLRRLVDTVHEMSRR